MTHRERVRVEYRDRMKDLGGRVMPSNDEAEAAVISAMFAGADSLDAAIAAGITADDFHRDANRRIAGVALELHGLGRPVDVVTVGHELRVREMLGAVGGVAKLATLVDATPSVAHVEAHVAVLRDLTRLRRAIEICQRRSAEGYDAGNVREYLDGLAQDVVDLAEQGAQVSATQVYDLMKACVERAAMTTAERGGWPTGFRRLDDQTGGWFPGQLIVIAARPGMGKSSYALNVAANMAALPRVDDDCDGYAVHFFSLEMPKEEIGHKLICSMTGIDTSAVRRRQLTPDERGEYNRGAWTLGNAPLWIYDASSLSVIEMRAIVRGAKRKMPRRRHVVMIDYLQLAKGERHERGSREEEVSGIARGCKAMAKDLGVPVAALSQLNRAVETRSASDKRPTLADLRESGEIEQAADVIEFIYREEYYDAQPWNEDQAIVDVAKQRNGPTGEQVIAFRKACTRFEDATDADRRRWTKPENVAPMRGGAQRRSRWEPRGGTGTDRRVPE